MIELTFYYGTEVVILEIRGNSVTFRTGGLQSTIEGIKLSKTGVIKEHPDLKDCEDWRAQGIRRFKDKLLNFKDEEEVASYLISDLRGHGYVPRFKKVNGFRRIALG